MSAALALYLVASQAGNTNIGRYSGITIQAQDADANADGVTWQLSANGTDGRATSLVFGKYRAPPIVKTIEGFDGPGGLVTFIVSEKYRS